MTPEEANAVVEEAIARSMGQEEQPDPSAQYEELAKIHVAALSDWTVQLAWMVADKRWDRIEDALLAANQSMQKLAGSVSKLLPPSEAQK